MWSLAWQVTRLRPVCHHRHGQHHQDHQAGYSNNKNNNVCICAIAIVSSSGSAAAASAASSSSCFFYNYVNSPHLNGDSVTLKNDIGLSPYFVENKDRRTCRRNKWTNRQTDRQTNGHTTYMTEYHIHCILKRWHHAYHLARCVCMSCHTTARHTTPHNTIVPVWWFSVLMSFQANICWIVGYL